MKDILVSKFDGEIIKNDIGKIKCAYMERFEGKKFSNQIDENEVIKQYIQSILDEKLKNGRIKDELQVLLHPDVIDVRKKIETFFDKYSDITERPEFKIGEHVRTNEVDEINVYRLFVNIDTNRYNDTLVWLTTIGIDTGDSDYGVQYEQFNEKKLFYFIVKIDNKKYFDYCSFNSLNKIVEFYEKRKRFEILAKDNGLYVSISGVFFDPYGDTFIKIIKKENIKNMERDRRSFYISFCFDSNYDITFVTSIACPYIYLWNGENF